MSQTNPAAYSTLPIGAVAPYTAPVAGPFERCLFLSPSASDAAAISASSSAGSLGPANLQNPEPTKKWRSIGAIESLTLTMPPGAYSDLAIIGHNLSDAGVVRVRSGSLDTGWQSVWPVTGKPVVENWPSYLSLLRWTNADLLSDWIVDLADPASPDGYMEAGRLMLGVAWQPTYNLDLDPSIGFVPIDVQEPNPYGQTFTDPRPWAQRQFDIAFSSANQDDVHDFAMELARLRGQSGDFVFCIDPAATTRFHQWSMQALFTGRAAYKAQPLWDGTNQTWGFSASLIEKL